MNKDQSPTPRIPLNPSELEKAVQRLHNYFKLTERHEDVLTDLFAVLSAAKRTASLEQQLLYANDAAEKGAKGRELGTAYEEAEKRVKELELLTEKMYEALMSSASYLRSQGYSTTHPVRLTIEQAILLAQQHGIGKDKK